MASVRGGHDGSGSGVLGEGKSGVVVVAGKTVSPDTCFVAERGRAKSSFVASSLSVYSHLGLRGGAGIPDWVAGICVYVCMYVLYLYVYTQTRTHAHTHTALLPTSYDSTSAWLIALVKIAVAQILKLMGVPVPAFLGTVYQLSIHVCICYVYMCLEILKLMGVCLSRYWVSLTVECVLLL